MSTQYTTVKKTVGLFDFSLEGKIIVKGPGRVDFINGLVSNDIKLLEINHGCYAMFLNKLGKILSDCIIYKLEGFLLLNMNILGKKNIIGMLKDEAALGKSEIEDASMKYALFSLQGPKSADFINYFFKKSIELKAEFETTIQKIEIDEKEIEIIIAKHSRTIHGGFDLFIPGPFYRIIKKAILEAGKMSNIAEIDNETYEILRLEAKKPLYGIDFDEKNILPEVSEKAVSYTKGCYVGQEIVVRVKNLAKGQTSKRLVSMEMGSSVVPKKNEKIMKEGKEAGLITSAVYSPERKKVIALGFLKKEFFDGKNLMAGERPITIGFL